jgi:hypothetical protein
MAMSFQKAFEEWVKDDRYQIIDDCGWEFADVLEAGPTPPFSSLANTKDGTADTAQEELDSGETS